MGNSSDDSFERLALRLGIPEFGREQDWDIVSADAGRVEEFCDVYERGSFDADAKAALMQLIVASYEERLRAFERDDDLEARITRLLEEDFELHRHTIEYWCGGKVGDLLIVRAVSPLMRRIRRAHGDGE